MELYNLLYIGDYGGFEHHEPMNVSNESIGNPVLNQAVFGRRVWRVSNTQEGGRGWAPRRPLAEKTCGLLGWPSQNWMNIGFTGNSGFTQLTVMSLDCWYIYIYIVGQNHGFLEKKHWTNPVRPPEGVYRAQYHFCGQKHVATLTDLEVRSSRKQVWILASRFNKSFEGTDLT